MGAELKEWLPILQVLATAISALTVWGIKTGRYTRGQEDDVRQHTRDIGDIRTYQTDLKRLVQMEHDQRRVDIDNIRHEIGELVERSAVTSQRVSDLDRRVERVENRK